MATSAPAPPGAVVVTADWNDVDAAVTAIEGRYEMAVLSSTRSTEEQAFELLMISDEPTFIYARRAPGAGDAMIPIALLCQVGYFGDPALEKQVTASLAGRLKDLVGVDVRPIRSSD